MVYKLTHLPSKSHSAHTLLNHCEMSHKILRKYLKDTQREISLSNKIQALAKSMNMDIWVVWVVATLN